MRKLPALGLALLIAMNTTLQSAGKDGDGNKSIRDRLVGAWRLASLEEPSVAGKLHQSDCTGLLVFTRDGHMSVQVMYSSSQDESDSAAVQYTQGGYEASFGTYEVDDAYTFTFHVEGALVRTLVGKSLKRVYRFSGDRLIVKSSDANEHWRVVWEPYQPHR